MSLWACQQSFNDCLTNACVSTAGQLEMFVVWIMYPTDAYKDKFNGEI